MYLNATSIFIVQIGGGNGLFLPLQLMVFKLVGLLFPTSDYRHPVTTPARCLLGHALSQVRDRSGSVPMVTDVTSGCVASSSSSVD